MATGAGIKDYTMDAMPLPDDTPVKVDEERQKQNMQQAQQLPRGAGFASKGGQISYIANNLLTGWMAGRHIKAEKELNKAKTDVTQSRSIYDSLAQVYSRNLEGGKAKDDPEMKKLAADVTTAWGNYVNTADKYTSPPDDAKGKKKSAGARIGGGVKKALGGQTDPELYRSAAVQIMRKTGPPVLQEDQSMQSKAAQSGMERNKYEFDKEKKDDKLKSDYQTAASKDEKDQTPEDQKAIKEYEASLGPKTEHQKLEDQFYSRMRSGKPLDEAEMQKFEAVGLFHRDRPSVTVEEKGDGTLYRFVVGSDGKQISAGPVLDANGKPFKKRVPPSAASQANSILEAHMRVARNEFIKIHGSDEQYQGEAGQAKLKKDAEATAANLAMPGFSRVLEDPAKAQQEQYHASDTIKTVLGELKKDNPKLAAVLGNFVVAPTDDPNGMYYWRANVVDPKDTGQSSGGFLGIGSKPAYYGGVSQDEISSYQRQITDLLRAAYKKRNKTATDAEVNRLFPPLYGGQQSSNLQMDPTPESGGKSITKAELQQVATENHVPYAEAEKQFRAKGYEVK